jgi:hypothetical protein
MTYETDLRKLYQEFKAYWNNNKERLIADDDLENEMRQWLKYAYVTGRRFK